jgi:hypothetical protein
MASWSGTTTLWKREVDGHEWHLYRRGKDGPLALTIRNLKVGTHTDLPVTPAGLKDVALAMFEQGYQQFSGVKLPDHDT